MMQDELSIKDNILRTALEYAKPEFDNGQMSQNSLFTKGYLFF